MADREKVTKGIWQCWCPSDSEEYETQCTDCPYFNPDGPIKDCMTELRRDAIALLKEQEAVEPMTDNEGGYWCKSCYEDIVWHQKYCSNCGRSVKWNDGKGMYKEAENRKLSRRKRV